LAPPPPLESVLQQNALNLPLPPPPPPLSPALLNLQPTNDIVGNQIIGNQSILSS